MYDGGNQVYDSFMLSPSYLGIVKAIPFVRSSLGSLSYEEELTVCVVKETNSSEESALSFHLSRRLTSTNAAFTNLNCVGEAIGRYGLVQCYIKHTSINGTFT